MPRLIVTKRLGDNPVIYDDTLDDIRADVERSPWRRGSCVVKGAPRLGDVLRTRPPVVEPCQQRLNGTEPVRPFSRVRDSDLVPVFGPTRMRLFHVLLACPESRSPSPSPSPRPAPCAEAERGQRGTGRLPFVESELRSSRQRIPTGSGNPSYRAVASLTIAATSGG